MQPAFFIIGAPKCGTTSLTESLASHRDIWIPQKEIGFFNTDHNSPKSRSLSTYKRLFREGKVCGDSSVWYLYSRQAVPNILNYNSEAKFIVCLRNPVEMVFSLHHQLVFSGDEDEQDLRRAWMLEAERQNGKPVRCHEPSQLFYSQTCALGQQVSRLLKHTDRVHFVLLEDMKSNPSSTVEQALEFLEIPQAQLSLRHSNVATKSRSPFLSRVLAQATTLKYKAGVTRSFGIGRTISQWNSTAAPWQRDESFGEQLRSYFQAEIALLAQLTKRDLSHWLKRPA